MTKVISYGGFKTTKYLFPAKALGDNVSIYFFNPSPNIQEKGLRIILHKLHMYLNWSLI